MAVSPEINLENVYFGSGESDKIFPISIPKKLRSKPKYYSGNGTLHFYIIINSDELIKENRKIIASTIINQEDDFPLLVFIPDEDADNTLFTIRKIEDSYSKIPGKSLNFFNMTNKPLGLFLGEEAEVRIPLKPENNYCYIHKEESPNLRLRVAIFEEGIAKASLDRRLFFNADARTLYFIYKIREGSPAVKLFGLRDSHKQAMQIQKTAPKNNNETDDTKDVETDI